MQVPAACSERVEPEIEQTVGVAGYRLTSSPELAEAAKGMTALALCAGIEANAMICCDLLFGAWATGSLAVCAGKTEPSATTRRATDAVDSPSPRRDSHMDVCP